MTTSILPRVAAAILGDRPWYAARTLAPVDPDESAILWLREPALDEGMRWATETDPHMDAYTVLNATAVAEILFCSRLGPDDGPTDALLCATVLDQLAACGCVLGRCVEQWATVCGDYPELAQPRMQACLAWAARIVGTAAAA